MQECACHRQERIQPEIDRIIFGGAAGHPEWRSCELARRVRGMLPRKILKTRTPKMPFPAIWRVNFTAKIDCQNV